MEFTVTSMLAVNPMLLEINPPLRDDGVTGPVPSFLAPLSIAARDGQSLEQPMLKIIDGLGFKSMFYGFTTARTMELDSRRYGWSTLPQSWLAEYEYHSYFEVDPFLADRWTNPTPIIWDQRINSVRPGVEHFLVHAARYGIRSGLAVYFRDEHYSRTMFAVYSPIEELSAARIFDWTQKLPAILILAIECHAIFRRRFVAARIPPLQQGAPLSPREVQCLQFAARGMTSADIGVKIGLVERTVNFHFCNIIGKLAVANRAEAIATAMTRGIIKT